MSILLTDMISFCSFFSASVQPVCLQAFSKVTYSFNEDIDKNIKDVYLLHVIVKQIFVAC